MEELEDLKIGEEHEIDSLEKKIAEYNAETTKEMLKKEELEQQAKVCFFFLKKKNLYHSVF